MGQTIVCNERAQCVNTSLRGDIRDPISQPMIQRFLSTQLPPLTLTMLSRDPVPPLTLTMLSRDPVQNRVTGSALWAGSHAREVIHFLCPRHCPRDSPEEGLQSRMFPSMSPLAMYRPSGDQATTSTQFRCPWQTGVEANRVNTRER